MRAGWWLIALAACGEAPTYVLLEVPVPSEDDAGVEPHPIDAGVVTDAGPRLFDDGTRCSRSDQCRGGTCLRDGAFPGGYCTLEHCRIDRQCDRPIGLCVSELGHDFCARSCGQGQPACRSGYACVDVGNGEVCLPGGVADRADGEPCTRDGECRGGTCLREWPGGHCTTRDCVDDLGCANDGLVSVCMPPDFTSSDQTVPICVRSCRAFADCRDDYACVRPFFVAAPGICLPDVLEPVAIPAGATQLICGRANGTDLRFDYDIPAGTTSYLATPFARDGRYVVPQRITLPRGQVIDFAGENAFQTYGALLHGFMNPTVIPATRDRRTQLQSGHHVYELESRSTDACLWLVTERSAGTRIDLRIYFTGTSAFNASSAPQDPAFQSFLAELGVVLGEGMIAIGSVIYRDVLGSAANDFRFLESEDELFALMERSEPAPANNPLLLDLFFVEGFGGQLFAAGIASALPGPAGLHGTRASGVAATAEYLGMVLVGPQGEEVDGSALTANIVAHEMGHYLGLFHTSESNGATWDPIDDTPECAPEDFPINCPDFGNLMFPFADLGNNQLSPGQIFSLGAHPLTKE